MPKVFVTYPMPDQFLEPLRGLAEVSKWPGPGRCPEDVALKQIADVDGVVGVMRWTPQVLDTAPKLRIIANTAVGYDSVDVPACTERGIIVTNTPGVLTDTTADLAFCLLVSVARRIGEAERFVRSGKWAANPSAGGAMLGLDIHHATLGVIGLGRIGAEVAHRGAGFHMNVIYHDAFRREDLEKQYGYKYVDLDTLLRESDFISLHVSLSDETRKMMGAAQFAKMKPTAFLINASRGGVVDEQALIEALRAKQIAGAGLDVFEKEPTPSDNPLLQMENVVVTPHIGSATGATRQAMMQLAVQNVAAVLTGKAPLTPVNPEVLQKARK